MEMQIKRRIGRKFRWGMSRVAKRLRHLGARLVRPDAAQGL